MRNVAFSVMLVALALLQVAVVSSELTSSSVHTAAVAKSKVGTMQVLASNEEARKTSSL
jgi:hypothetical protein